MQQAHRTLGDINFVLSDIARPGTDQAIQRGSIDPVRIYQDEITYAHVRHGLNVRCGIAAKPNHADPRL